MAYHGHSNYGLSQLQAIKLTGYQNKGYRNFGLIPYFDILILLSLAL